MSTVIGLLKEDKQLTNLTGKLEAAGCALDQIKILTRSGQVHALLDEKARTRCQMGRCVSMGILIGLAIFIPIGFTTSLIGCRVFGCSPLIWLFGLGGLSFLGAAFGAIFGCFFGADRFEHSTHVYTEGVGWGNKLVAVTADTPEMEARMARIMHQEHAIAIRILQNQG